MNWYKRANAIEPTQIVGFLQNIFQQANAGTQIADNQIQPLVESQPSQLEASIQEALYNMYQTSPIPQPVSDVANYIRSTLTDPQQTQEQPAEMVGNPNADTQEIGDIGTITENQ